MKAAHMPVLGIALASLGFVPLTHAGGNITPPDSAFSNGVPFARMKTLDQLEPRSPIFRLPHVIDTPGSYYLTGSLNMEEFPGSNGITIACGDVRVDLNGFSLYGGSNSMHAIRDNSSASGEVYNVSVYNGAIIGWGGWGMNCPSMGESEITRVKFYENGAGGGRSWGTRF